MRCLAFVVALLIYPSVAFTACEGRDWRDVLAPETMREIRARVSEVPFHEGIAFEATHGETRLTLFGTVHVYGSRVFVPEKISARIREADLLLVELSSDAALRLRLWLEANPALTFDDADPGLKSRLSADEWDALLGALAALEFGPDEADRMRPWVATLVLEESPCELAVKLLGAKNLDDRVEALARDAGVAVGALDAEPEQVLSFFIDMTEEEQLDELRLLLATHVADGSEIVNIVESWKDEEVAAYWEVARAYAAALSGDAPSVNASFDRMYEQLVEVRNRDWMTRILELSGEARNIVIAVGGLHLPGDNGLLRLLEREGFAIHRLSVF